VADNKLEACPTETVADNKLEACPAEPRPDNKLEACPAETAADNKLEACPAETRRKSLNSDFRNPSRKCGTCVAPLELDPVSGRLGCTAARRIPVE
jgi:hypothetical protein